MVDRKKDWKDELRLKHDDKTTQKRDEDTAQLEKMQDKISDEVEENRREKKKAKTDEKSPEVVAFNKDAESKMH